LFVTLQASQPQSDSPLFVTLQASHPQIDSSQFVTLQASQPQSDSSLFVTLQAPLSRCKRFAMLQAPHFFFHCHMKKYLNKVFFFNLNLYICLVVNHHTNC
jgi:hypothetical protein